MRGICRGMGILGRFCCRFAGAGGWRYFFVGLWMVVCTFFFIYM